MYSKKLVLATAALLAATALAACSTSTQSSSSSAPASAQPAASRLAAAEPLHVTEADMGTSITMAPEQMVIIDVDTPAGSELFVTSDNSDAVSIDQAEGSGAVTASPAVIAKKPGTALITVQAINDSEDSTPPTVLSFTIVVQG